MPTLSRYTTAIPARKEHTVPTSATDVNASSTLAADSAQEASTTRVANEWPRVSIADVHCHHCRDFADRPTVTVQAWLSLGSLLPLDVRVTCRPSQSGRSGRREYRLWSVDSNNAGIFRFETPIAADDVDAYHGYTLSVAPAHESPAPLKPIERWVPPFSATADEIDTHHLLPRPRAGTPRLATSSAHATR